jgi:hypothetical protein
MNNKNPIPNEAVNDAQALADALDAALAELDNTVFGGLNPLEQAAERRIRQAATRLLQCAEELAGVPLLIPGSTGQQRPHPLLKVEHELRREIIGALEKLTFRATNRSFVEKQKARHRALRDLADAATPRPEDTP